MNESDRKQRGAAKTARIPVKVETTTRPPRKPAWIRARSPANPAVGRLKEVLRTNRLHTVCEEAPGVSRWSSHMAL
jgi:lipoic acid synthetase